MDPLTQTKQTFFFCFFLGRPYSRRSRDAISTHTKKNLDEKTIRFNKFSYQVLKWKFGRARKRRWEIPDENNKIKIRKPKGTGLYYSRYARGGISAYRWARRCCFTNPAFKTCQDHFLFEAFDISNRREISGRHGVALARNYLYPSIVVLVAAAVVVVYPYCCSNLIRYFLWPEQQTSKTVAYAPFVTQKKSEPGPCGRSVCIPPTHLCPRLPKTNNNNNNNNRNSPKKLRGEKKNENLLSAQG